MLLPGPNKLLNDSSWVLNSETLVNTGNPKGDLSQYFHGLYLLYYLREVIGSQQYPEGAVHLFRIQLLPEYISPFTVTFPE
jgi:hypothetical protein